MSLSLCLFLGLLPFLTIGQQTSVNVALNKPIVASITCGATPEDYFGHSEARKPQNERTEEVCDQNVPELAHPPEYIVDGDPNTWWQSTSKLKLTELNMVFPDSKITLELGQEYAIDSISIQIGDSQRPGQMGIFKSLTFENYKQWMFLVTTQNECSKFDGVQFNLDVDSLNSVTCTTYGTRAQSGNETVLINPPVVEGFEDWRKTKFLEFRFYDMDFTFGFLADNYHHYTVKEITVMAECICNAHANTCELQPLPDDASKNAYQCVCSDNTQGFACQECLPFYNQEPYQTGENGFQCQACNCFDHSDSCYYDINVATLQQSLNADGIYSGGGVCIDCANNTSGNNCEKCHELYFRPLDKQQTDIDACQPCDCFLPGTKEDLDIGLARGHCVMNNETLRPPGMEPGDCFCKDNVEGVKCDVCRDGFYDLSASNLGGCLDCTCNIAGTLGNTTVCDKDTGLCPCKTYATERRCDECMDEYYGLSLFNDDACDPCGCNVGGSMDNVCNKLNGQCFCWNNILGQICDSVASEAYYPDVHFINAELESITATNWGRDEEYDGYFWYGYVSLSSGESSTTSLSIPSDTTFSGQYELLFHYIADNPTMVTVTLTSNGGLSNPISLSGSTTLSQCPDTWCYQSLNNADGISGNTFALTAGVWSVNVVSGISSGQVLLDRIIALPVEFLSPEVLLGADTATQFDVDCDVRNNIMNSTGNIEFCLEQVFILTTNYLQGALPCDCDLVGSYNNLCDEYGGQCACKTGVGGRRCDMCLPEYYAYSSTGCQPCNCFNDDKVCNMLTGQCDCPPNTVGRNCDRCVTYTYGLNSTHGCTPCNCDVEGSSNLQCDAVTGECACQPGVDGTTSSAEGAGKCTECKDGFKSFTLIGCEPCDCSLDGSVNIACNKTSGQCPCKVNTEGMLCDNCKAGTFYNSESHPTGCLQCVCMGITEDCRSSTLKNIQFQIPTDSNSQSDWILMDDSTGNNPSDQNTSVILIDDISYLSFETLGLTDSYWTVSTALNGNILGSYGTLLQFSLQFESDVAGDVNPQPTVILQGLGNRYKHVLDPLVNNQTSMMSIMMVEWDWKIEATDANITRSDFLKTLSDVDMILIQANLYTGQHMSSIGDVSYYKATGPGPNYDITADTALAIENCICGPEYEGLSCEECASGYFRQNQTIHDYFGVCVLCDCNGHSDVCDKNTGECLNCQHNTAGFNCELCADGFYGDASQGEADDCESCPCSAPKTVTALCEFIDSIVTCINCSDGHTGPLCNQCEDFYYGQPELPNGFCTACDCNGNSDQCDSITGECIDCQFDTTGFNCERCIDYQFGNASQQNCQECACNSVGSTSQLCDHETGQCPCKSGVTGRQCDGCQENFYGFINGDGCVDCECNPYGSTKLQCNDAGICPCKTGSATNIKCDTCTDGRFGLPYQECEMCGCSVTGTVSASFNAGTCDSITGQCDCKNGVNSRQCDECLPTWVDFSIDGCTECNQCTQTLYEAVTELTTNWDDYYDTASWVSELQDRDRELQSLMQVMNVSVTDLQNDQQLFVDLRTAVDAVDTVSYTTLVSNLNSRVNSVSLEVDQILEDSRTQSERIQDIGTESEDAYNAVYEASTNAVDYVNMLTQWNNSATTVLQQMTNLGGGVTNINFDTQLTAVETELEKCQQISVDANVFLQANLEQALETNRLQSLVTAADAQFTDMQSSLDNTNQILGTATDSLNQAVSILNDTQDQVTFAQNLVSEVETSQNNINTVLTTASSDITSAGQLFSDTLEVKNGGSESTAPVPPSVNQLGYNGWTSVLDDVKSHTSSVIDQQGNAEVFVRAAEIYASKLYNTSRDTLEVFQEAQDHGQPAVDAIDSYQQAITTLEEATAKAVEANTTIAEALNYVNEVSVSKIQEEAASSQTSSNDLKNSVENRNIDPAALQLRLTEANGTLAVAEQTWAQVEENYAALQVEASGLDLTSQDPGITPIVTTATSTATKAILDANEVITASTILNEDIKIDQQNVVIVQQSVANATVLNAELDTLVPQIESDLVDLSSTVDTLTDLQNETSYQRSDINSRMAILQQKLAQAQQAVANSKQPVHFSAHSSMQYLRSEPLETYLYNSISLKVKAETPNGLLFFTENDPADVLMAIEVINGHPVFRFNLGQDLVSVESPVDICCNSWYEIIATRYGYESRISVKDMTTGGAALEYTKSVVTYEKYLRLGLDSVLFVGGLPVNYPLNTTSDSVPEVSNAISQLDESSLVQIIPLQNRDYVGCLSNVQFDDQELNLWLADLQEGSMTCCNRPTIVTPPDPALTDGVSFTGYGYMELPMETFDIYSSASMSVEFRTSMKDAVLILLSRPDLVAYIGLYIYNRKLLFQYKLSGALVQTIETVADFNDATWYKTTCGFNSTSIFLSVESSDGDISESYVMPLLVTPITFPNLQTGTRLTLGSSIDNTLRGPTNLKFAGCMRKLMLTNGTSMNLIPRPMTNTTAVSYSDVSFSGCLADVDPGIGFDLTSTSYTYAALDITPITVEQIEFFFKTTEPDGILVYSYDTITYNRLFYITLYHGNIFIQYNTGTGDGLSEPLQTSNQYLNNGQWQQVKVDFSGLAATLKVNKNPIIASNRQISTSGISISGGSSYVYLGGVPSTIPDMIGGDFPVRESLHGDIDQFKVNSEDAEENNYDPEYNFNDGNIVVSSLGLILKDITPAVTTLPPLPYVTLPPPTGTAAPTTCKDPVQVVESNDGYSLGSSGNSFLAFTHDDLQDYLITSFVLTLEFRAVSSNGLMYYAAESYQNPINWMALSMIDGYLSFSIVTSSRELTGINVQTKMRYDTGEWTEVLVLRINDFVAIMVPDTRDYKNNNQQSNAIESTLEINTPLYVGGVDTALIDNTFPLDSTLGFNGCVRKVELSTDVPDIPINFDLSTPTSSANVDACLLNKVIDGASMEGFGYIQQENNFAVGDMIEVNMVFRTTINNALLLAIADDLGYFFTIDISDGKVRAVVSHGTGSSPYIVRTTSVQSEYTICNDEEHQVIVSMSQTGLQITLDSYLPDSTPFDTGTNFIYTNSPVFVGGMPDYAATLVLDGINTKSLRGCIQTLVINGDVKDLREPEYSQGVSNGCPLPL